MASNSLQRKVEKILSSSGVAHSVDFLDSLHGLSGFYSENSLNNRRNLRTLLTKRSIRLNHQLLEQFGDVKKVLFISLLDLQDNPIIN